MHSGINALFLMRHTDHLQNAVATRVVGSKISISLAEQTTLQQPNRRKLAVNRISQGSSHQETSINHEIVRLKIYKLQMELLRTVVP